jgi:hypothetical protein
MLNVEPRLVLHRKLRQVIRAITATTQLRHACLMIHHWRVWMEAQMEARGVCKPMEPSALSPLPITVMPTTPTEETFPHNSLWNESTDPSAKSWTNTGSGAPSRDGRRHERGTCNHLG